MDFLVFKRLLATSIIGMVLLILTLSQLEAKTEKQKPTITLATMEIEPYSGKNLPNLGYVSELVKTVLENKGYQVNIEFYPRARVNFMAVNGLIDGIMPIRFQQQYTEALSYSAPFPGARQGFLKKKSTKVIEAITSQNDISNFLQNHSENSFGIVRGTPFVEQFDTSDEFNKMQVSDSLHNLDMLASDRVEFAIMDFFTAADLIVNYRPQYIGQFDFIRAHLFDSNFYVAFSKKRPLHKKLTIDFNQGLAELISNGGLARILSKHGFYEPKIIDTSKRHLVVGAADINNVECLQKRSQAFSSAHPEVEIEWRTFNENTLRKRLLADFAVDNGTFDLVMIGEFEAKIWAERKWLASLSELPAGFHVNDHFRIALEALSHEGDTFGLPVSAESIVTYYRNDLMEKAGLKIGNKPSFKEIAELAKALHQPEKGVYGIGLRGKAGWGQNIATITMLVGRFGGQWFDEHWKPQLNTKEWREALTFYVDILQKYGPPDVHLNGWKENQQMFADGKLAMLIDASVLADYLFDPATSNVTDKISLTSHPIQNENRETQWFWTWGLALPDSSQQKALAKDLAVWLTSSESGNKETFDCNQYSAYTARTDSKDDRTVGKSYTDYISAQMNTLKPIYLTNLDTTVVGEQFVPIPEFPAIGFQVGLKIQQILEGKLSVNAALQESQEITEKIMRDAGYIK